MKRGGLRLESGIIRKDRSHFKLRLSSKSISADPILRHPVRGLKVFSKPCFCYLNTIIVCKHVINIGLRHSFHIIPLPETTVL